MRELWGSLMWLLCRLIDTAQLMWWSVYFLLVFVQFSSVDALTSWFPAVYPVEHKWVAMGL